MRRRRSRERESRYDGRSRTPDDRGSRRSRRALRAVVTGSIALFVAASLFSGVALAQSSGDVAVEQDGACWVVDPVSTDQDVEEYYDYGEPGYTYTYSSHGTVEYQENDTSILLFHEGSDGTSLVVVHDRLTDPGVHGTDGGVTTFEVSGLPADGEWAVEDDDYDDQTDEFYHDGSESELHWVWTTNRSDGAAFNGVDSDSVIRIDPRWNDEAYLDPTHSGEEGEISEWQVIDSTGDGFDRVSLDMNEPVRIWQGSCSDLSASISASTTTATVDETVTFDASDSESPRGIEEYRWDLDGDGETDETTTEPTFDHAFEESGTYDASVTVVGDAGETATAEVSVSVTEDEPPSATLDVTDSTTVGESVTFDAGDSTVNDPPATYEWRVDGEPVDTTDESSYEYAFEAAGDHEVGVVVTDSADRTDEATATVSVSESLSADIETPEEPITVNESVTFDGGGSTGEVASYEWVFRGGEDTTATGETAEHAYESAGEYEVQLTVTGEDGETARATETVTVEAPAPTAAISGPDEAALDEPVTFDASDSTSTAGDLAFEWRVDGDVADDADGPTMEYGFEESGEHSVSVTVTDDEGQSDTAETTVSVAADVEARIDAPQEATADETLTFDGGGSTGGIESYEWTFGDGSTDSGESVDHVYESDGEYEVTLTVTDDDGNTAQATETVTVGAPELTASISAPDEATVNETLTFNASGSAGDIVSYRWTFDDGSTDSGETVDHAFESAGEYEVGLTIDDAYDQTAVENATITVAENESDDTDEKDSEDNKDEKDNKDDKSDDEKDDKSDDEKDKSDDGNEGNNGGNSGGSTGGAPSSGGSSGGGSSGGPSANSPDDAGSNPSVIAVEAPSAVVDRPFEVNVTVENEGSLLATEKVPVTVDGEERANVSVTVPPGENVTASTTVNASEEGPVRIEAGDVSTTTTVQPATADLRVAAVDVESQRIDAGEEAALVATVTNEGTVAGEYRAELSVAGSVSQVETVRVAPGEEARLRLTQELESPGTYNLSVGERNAQVTVDDEDDGSGAAGTTETTETTETVDGFGIPTVLLASLVAAVLLIGRRRTSG